MLVALWSACSWQSTLVIKLHRRRKKLKNLKNKNTHPRHNKPIMSRIPTFSPSSKAVFSHAQHTVPCRSMIFSQSGILSPTKSSTSLSIPSKLRSHSSSSFSLAFAVFPAFTHIKIYFRNHFVHNMSTIIWFFILRILMIKQKGHKNTPSDFSNGVATDY